MQKLSILFMLFWGGMLFTNCSQPEKQVPTSTYPSVSERYEEVKPMFFYIDPKEGDNENNGLSEKDAWRDFAPINRRILKAGSKVNVIQSGDFETSLCLIGKGTTSNPITVNFAPGVYHFFPDSAFTKQLQISNTNDDPSGEKRIAIYLRESKNIRLRGKDATFLARGKTMFVGVQECENLSVSGFTFDFLRPTVSEFSLLSVGKDKAVAKVHYDSPFQIKDSLLLWKGEGWEHEIKDLMQVNDSRKVWRSGFDVKKWKFSIGDAPDQFTMHYPEKPKDFKKGFVYQNRDTFRDYSAFFSERSKNIVWRGIKVNYMHGMGFVSQFCENIQFIDTQVKPEENSGRTCSAWADILHFSNCKGEIQINSCELSGANDDAINVHGTYLRIRRAISANKVLVAFMHPQTYGFKPFDVGDEVSFIDGDCLSSYQSNRVTSVSELDSMNYVLTLANTVPSNIKPNDALENKTWNADVTIRNTTTSFIPTRGFLLSSSGNIVVENNIFERINMSAILIAGDVNNWFESGSVNNVTIQGNSFVGCGSPLLNIHPENKESKEGEFVHHNIHFVDNAISHNKGTVVSARSVNNLVVTGNTFDDKEQESFLEDLVETSFCKGVCIE